MELGPYSDNLKAAESRWATRSLPGRFHETPRRLSRKSLIHKAVCTPQIRCVEVDIL